MPLFDVEVWIGDDRVRIYRVEADSGVSAWIAVNESVFTDMRIRSTAHQVPLYDEDEEPDKWARVDNAGRFQLIKEEEV